MNETIQWLESHENLSGWAQFIGALFALALTYFTAFYPSWKRRKQLKLAAVRLLSHGYESLESYHRTSANFLPFPLSLRFAALTMNGVAADIGRFPVFDLEDQGPRSTARALVSISMTLSAAALYLETMARELDNRVADIEDQRGIREFVGERLQQVEDLLTGKELKRPVWPISDTVDGG